jgi:hypothetical protein
MPSKRFLHAAGVAEGAGLKVEDIAATGRKDSQPDSVRGISVKGMGQRHSEGKFP